MAISAFSYLALRQIIPAAARSWQISGAGCILPRQTFHRRFSKYEDINLLASVAEQSRRVLIQGYDVDGFTANGFDLEGSIFCIGSLLLHWSPASIKEVTPDSLALLQLLRPLPELLILGSGRSIQPVSEELRTFLRQLGIKLEIVDSANAASTFNFLMEEGRNVAGALLPTGAE